MKTIVTETTPLNAHGVDTVSQKIRESLTAYPFLKRRDIHDNDMCKKQEPPLCQVTALMLML